MDKKKNNMYKNMYKNMYGIDDKVSELKYKDFLIKKDELFIKHQDFLDNKSLIIFYAPWCQHCNKMYDDICELSITNLYKFKIGAVNINDIKNKNNILSDTLNIKYIPSIYIIKNKKLVLFNKEATFENIFYYINMNI
jgi:thiol-disulfide isomerase/thioredoxin